MRFSDGPHFEPSSRYSRGHVLLYSVPISQCTPLHSRARRLLAIIQSRSEAGIIRSRQAKVGLSDPSLVLHSLRHGGIHKLHAAGAPHNVVEVLAGHAASGVHGKVYEHRELG